MVGGCQSINYVRVLIKLFNRLWGENTSLKQSVKQKRFILRRCLLSSQQFGQTKLDQFFFHKI